MRPIVFIAFALCVATSAIPAAHAHDTWVQTNTNIVRAGDAIYVDLMLGNHGNDHRDFKVAGKADIESSTLEILAPGGVHYDLKERITDNGYAPAEGFWSARFVPTAPGNYLVAHTSDKVVSYAPLRSIKSGKTYFVVSPSLDRVSATYPLHDQPLGHALELVPTTNTVTPMGPGRPIAVQVLYHGQPLPDARVSFIPRGISLREGFDDHYERKADSQGRASFTPQEGNAYLVVTHHVDATAGGEGHKGTKYSATLTVYVPQLCPCCDTVDE